MIEEEGPKLSLPLGIVKESIEGRDGCERTVRVKVKRGEVINSKVEEVRIGCRKCAGRRQGECV